MNYYSSALPVAGPADFAWAQQQFAKSRIEQDRKYRSGMRQLVKQMEAQGPVKAALKNAIWLGAGFGILGSILGPKNGHSRVLSYGAWGAFAGVGSSFLAYYFLEGMKPSFEEPKA